MRVKLTGERFDFMAQAAKQPARRSFSEVGCSPMFMSWRVCLPAVWWEVAFEIHGGVENSDDFKLFGVGAEEYDVFSFDCDPASGEEIRAESVAVRMEA